MLILFINWKKACRNGNLSMNLGNKYITGEDSERTVIEGLVMR